MWKRNSSPTSQRRGPFKAPNSPEIEFTMGDKMTKKRIRWLSEPHFFPKTGRHCGESVIATAHLSRRASHYQPAEAGGPRGPQQIQLQRHLSRPDTVRGCLHSSWTLRAVIRNSRETEQVGQRHLRRHRTLECSRIIAGHFRAASRFQPTTPAFSLSQTTDWEREAGRECRRRWRVWHKFHDENTGVSVGHEVHLFPMCNSTKFLRRNFTFHRQFLIAMHVYHELPGVCLRNCWQLLRNCMFFSPDSANFTRMPDAEVEKRFMQFVKEEYNGIAETVYSQLANAVWLFETNVTNYNEAAMVCHREERCRPHRTCKIVQRTVNSHADASGRSSIKKCKTNPNEQSFSAKIIEKTTTFFEKYINLKPHDTVAPEGSPKRGVRSKNIQGSPLWLRRGPKKFVKGGVLPFFARTKFRRGPRPPGPNGPGATDMIVLFQINMKTHQASSNRPDDNYYC